MSYLTREQIIAAEDLKSEDVEVPEWGGKVLVRSLTGTDRDKLGASLIGPDGHPNKGKYRVGLVAASMVDENGNPLFGFDEVDALGKKSSAALDRVYAVAERLNGIGEADVKAAEGN